MSALKLFYIFSLIKRVNLTKTYFPIIPAFYAVFYLIKERSISSTTLQFIFVSSLSIVASFLYDFPVNYIRYAQLVALFIFAEFSLKYISEKNLTLSLKAIVYIAIISLIIEMNFLPQIYADRTFLVFKRTAGLVGEPNFSAAVLFVIGSFFTIKRNYFWTILTLFIGMFNCSRGYYVSVTILSILVVIRTLGSKRIKYFLGYLLMTSFLTYPILLEVGHQVLPKEQFRKFYDLNSRIKHQLFFIDEFKSKPFGIGLSRSIDQYTKSHRNIFVLNPDPSLDRVNEQHNLMTQVISELGIIFYLFLLWQFFKIIKYKETVLNISIIIVPYFFLNGINEVLLYLLIPRLIVSGKNNELENSQCA